MISAIQHVIDRRRILNRRFDVAAQFEEIEETCIPSYLHGNVLAAAVAWGRLFAAGRHYRRHAPAGPVLDFGCGPAEIVHLLGRNLDYGFIEQSEPLVRMVAENKPDAKRYRLENLPDGHFAAILALDSLEHNDDIVAMIARLRQALRPDGALIVSGPTENVIYRFGRRLAGFSGHYHHQTIYDIEAAIGTGMRRIAASVVPVGLPLFRVSTWSRTT